MPGTSIREIISINYRKRAGRILYWCWIAYMAQAGAGIIVGIGTAFVITRPFQ